LAGIYAAQPLGLLVKGNMVFDLFLVFVSICNVNNFASFSDARGYFGAGVAAIQMTVSGKLER
jgi:hypothetical protein